MEFILSYGWAMLIVVTTISTLAFFKVDLVKTPTRAQIVQPLLHVPDHKVVGSNSEFEETHNSYYIVVRNSEPADVTLLSVSILKEGERCGYFAAAETITLQQDELSEQLLGYITDPTCQGKIGEGYRLDLQVKYLNRKTGLTHVANGFIQGEYVDTTDRWEIEPWTIGALKGPNDMDLENKNDNELAFCTTPAPPSNVGSFSEFDETALITWKGEPSGCSNEKSGGKRIFHQNGFADTCGHTAGNLAQGWLHTRIYLDEIFKGHSVLISGLAGYYDLQGNYRTDGICLDDNLYFYIGNKMLHHGGTSGHMVTKDNRLEPGEEILKNCDVCSGIKASSWCVPPFNLTATNDFKWGEDNDIYILVEDFCKGGGMSPLKVSII